MTAARSRVTLADVADAAGVDVSLVSRVLRGAEVSIREDTRERIRLHAQRLGYRPNAAARSLRTARANAYGLVIPDFTNPVYAEIITGAEQAAAERDCVLLTGSGTGWNRADWYHALGGGRVDGLLVTGGTDVDLSALNVPFLLVNRKHAGADRYVVLADERAASLAVDHLVSLGHRRIGLLGGPDEADTAGRRRTGYRSALERHGIAADSSIEVKTDYTAAGGAGAAAALMAAEPAVTAIVAANITSAVGATQFLRAAGYVIPSDLSLVAIHDADLANYLWPPLTTVRMPLAQLGSRAITLLADSARDARITETVQTPMTLVVRASTAPPAR